MKMDGENKGKPYFLMDDLGGRPTPIFGSTPKCVFFHQALAQFSFLMGAFEYGAVCFVGWSANGGTLGMPDMQRSIP